MQKEKRLKMMTKKKLEMVIKASKDYCKPMKTLTVDRVEFLQKEQSKDESFEDYL